MHARVSTYQGPARLSDDEVQEIVRRQQEEVLPAVRAMEGYNGVFSLMDRGNGKVLSVTLWEGETAMQASEAAAHQARVQAAEIGSDLVVGVERFEVTFWEMA